MMWLDAAPYGSSSCIVNTAFQFFYFKFYFTKFLKKVCFLMFLFGSARIRIELKCWIRIWIQVNPDPQPCGGQAAA
jgi:hypothetical protein